MCGGGGGGGGGRASDSERLQQRLLKASFSVDVMYYFVCTVLSKEKFANRHNHVFYILYSA